VNSGAPEGKAISCSTSGTINENDCSEYELNVVTGVLYPYTTKPVYTEINQFILYKPKFKYSSNVVQTPVYSKHKSWY
jgi:hypothetical protein